MPPGESLAQVLSVAPTDGQKREGPPMRYTSGRMGGKARLRKLAPEQRREIAREASLARWDKEKKKKEGS